MFDSKKKPTLDVMVEQQRSDLSGELLGVGSEFPGIAANPLLSRAARELTGLAPGQTKPVRYRPAVMDHSVALARDTEPADVEKLIALIVSRR